MKKNYLLLILATFFMAQLFSTACTKTDKAADAPEAYPIATADTVAPDVQSKDTAEVAKKAAPATVWDGLLEKYACDSTVNQLLFIKCVKGSQAEACFYVKDAQGKWVLDMERSADIGQYGIGKTREGDRKTPEGEFGVRQAFGILDNPGTKHKYYKVTNDTYCCGEHGKYYNTIIEASKVHHQCRGEHMIKYKPQYDYGFETTYNNKNVHGKGSAIFVHCKGSKGYTLGCIGLDKDMMKHVIQNSDPGIKICIHKK